MIRDDYYEVNIQNAEEGTVCVFDLHPDLWYDWGDVLISMQELKMVEESALVRISKDNKFDSTKGVIKLGLIAGANFKVDV